MKLTLVVVDDDGLFALMTSERSFSSVFVVSLVLILNIVENILTVKSKMTFFL